MESERVNWMEHAYALLDILCLAVVSAAIPRRKHAGPMDAVVAL
jgi:hypothetical protein